MKHSLCILLTLALLGGCTSSKQVFLETGEVGYRLKCGGKTYGSWSNCYEKAGEVCTSNGYDVVSQIYDDFSGGVRNLWIKCGTLYPTAAAPVQ